MSSIHLTGFDIAHAPFLYRNQLNQLSVFFHGRYESQQQAIWQGVVSDGHITNLTNLTPGETAKCFNPIVYEIHDQLWLFYKTGDAPYNWQGRIKVFDGQNWSASMKLPNDLVGPTKSRPLCINDTLLLPSSRERGAERPIIESLNYMTGQTDIIELPLPSDLNVKTNHFIQPALYQKPNGDITAYVRSSLGVLFQSSSHDGGKSFSPLTATHIANPNSAIALLPCEQGFYLAYNPSSKSRNRLVVDLINDEHQIIKRIFDTTGVGHQLAYPNLCLVNQDSLALAYSFDQKSITLTQLTRFKG